MTQFMLLSDGINRRRVAGDRWEPLSKTDANALLDAYAECAELLAELRNEVSGRPRPHMMIPLTSRIAVALVKLEALK